MDTREIGATGLHVTTLGVGGAPLGNDVADHEEDLAISAVQRSYESGIRYFDTAPIYGLGRSERRIGRALGGGSKRAVCHFHQGRQAPRTQ